MKILKYSFLPLLLVCVSFTLAAQGESNESNETPNKPKPTTEENEQISFGIDDFFKEPLVQDAAYEKVMAKEKIALPYDHIREADVFWSKRVWRVIDTRAKKNQAFINPNQPFITVLMRILEEHPDVEIFTDDTFTERQPVGDLKSRLSSVDTSMVYDFELDDYIQKVVVNSFNPVSYSKFRLKEDWLFDEETSTMVTRVMAISPIRDVINEDGSVRGQEALFWIYYPSLRPYLCKYEANMNDNDAIKMTWEDIFEMRYFDSYVMKESNASDRRISDYATGKDALMESRRINKEIQNKEQSLWEE
ncbi:MAG: gliding motility protein GldN [Chitinophagales bacterium]|nr:gliding motility protein GldN [Bacteroidota bacterium]MCB9043561.1 gliding motility protein GldN [Chitinophagales bacterium]